MLTTDADGHARHKANDYIDTWHRLRSRDLGTKPSFVLSYPGLASLLHDPVDLGTVGIYLVDPVSHHVSPAAERTRGAASARTASITAGDFNSVRWKLQGICK